MFKRKSFFILLFCCLGFSPAVFAQQQTLSGKVTDEKSVPLNGAAIKVSGSRFGVTTDANGIFTIKAAKGQVLVISYIGMADQQVTVSDDTNVDITLQEQIGSNLNDMVVVGYGTQAKKDLTGSIGVVPQSKMENQATVGIGQNLQGKLAGVQVIQNDGTLYAGTQIRIRGTGSFGASSNPLIVIDGMITNDGLANLNPNDVESITVLKDAASAAIYGSRGANGVVIVTTKKGNFESPMKVNFSGYAGVDEIRYKIPTLTAKNMQFR